MRPPCATQFWICGLKIKNLKHKPLVENPCCYPGHRWFIDTFTNWGVTAKWSHQDDRRKFLSLKNETTEARSSLLFFYISGVSPWVNGNKGFKQRRRQKTTIWLVESEKINNWGLTAKWSHQDGFKNETIEARSSLFFFGSVAYTNLILRVCPTIDDKNEPISAREISWWASIIKNGKEQIVKNNTY